MRAIALLCLLSQLTACAELVRWPERMERRGGSTRVVTAPQGHYVVKAGDTVYSIAFRNQLDFRELAQWNEIGRDYLIRPGQVLRLAAPPGGVQQPAPRTMRRAPSPAQEVPPAAPMPPMRADGWQWPTTGLVVRKFGEDGANKGIDISGTTGQPVVAAGAGRVVYSGSALKGYGELIIIKHDDLYLSAYGYNRRRMVREGDEVRPGQQIAELGVGPEQKPMLHFEIRRKGKPVDPQGVLPGG